MSVASLCLLLLVTDVARLVVLSAVTYINQVRAFETTKAPRHKGKGSQLLNMDFMPSSASPR